MKYEEGGDLGGNYLDQLAALNDYLVAAWWMEKDPTLRACCTL